MDDDAVEMEHADGEMVVDAPQPGRRTMPLEVDKYCVRATTARHTSTKSSGYMEASSAFIFTKFYRADLGKAMCHVARAVSSLPIKCLFFSAECPI